MIPKIIHFCWFGRGSRDPLVERCIATWRTILPDYEIIEWNEDNFDVKSSLYTMQAYENKKWAFVSDYVRLYVLNKYGGVYLDTDVELIHSFEHLFLDYDFITGFEDNELITTSFLASTSNNSLVSQALISYDRPFLLNDGSVDTTPNTKILTKTIESLYNVSIKNRSDFNFDNELVIYPAHVFSPKSHLDGKIRINNETVSIHHFKGSWFSPSQKRNKFLIKLFVNTFGENAYQVLKKIVKKVI